MTSQQCTFNSERDRHILLKETCKLKQQQHCSQVEAEDSVSSSALLNYVRGQDNGEGMCEEEKYEKEFSIVRSTKIANEVIEMPHDEVAYLEEFRPVLMKYHFLSSETIHQRKGM